MRVKDLGEREILKRIRSLMASPTIGDDCAALPFGDYYLLLTIDGIHEETDIPKGSTFYEIGWYACASTISDIASKGGRPLSVLVSLFLPDNMEERLVMEFLKGVESCASLYGAGLDGGDLNYGDSFSADVVGLGLVEKEYYVSRYGAMPGDLVIVTGTFGTPSAVLEKILKGEHTPKHVREKLLMPRPRVREAIFLTSTGLITASIDSSDGLYESLRTLSESSEVKIVIDYEKIPKDEWLERNFSEEQVFKHVLFGGGEFELVMTARPEIIDYINRISELTGTDITIIGEVLEGRGVYISHQGEIVEVCGHGWDTFRSKGNRHTRWHGSSGNS
ncbi:MAG: thiamine-phosphate kinase [Euryarchaeota archaeon]|nr:thiamine-phosphate kinase [Euryarchaeota archaeon]